MTRSISLFLVVLVVFGPINLMAGEVAAGQAAPKVRSSFESVAPGHITGMIATPERTVHVKMVRGQMITADNYSLQVRVLDNDDRGAVLKLIARTPSGEMKTGMLVVDKQSGTTEKVGVDDVRNLLSTSADFSVLRSALPAMTKDSNAPSLGNRIPGLVANDACTTAMLTMALAVFCLVFCETGIGCIGAILGIIAATSGLMDSCGGTGTAPDYSTEPPCTSYSIC